MHIFINFVNVDGFFLSLRPIPTSNLFIVFFEAGELMLAFFLVPEVLDFRDEAFDGVFDGTSWRTSGFDSSCFGGKN